MLAGERFSDQPQSVCPVIAGFLRGYNDLLPDADRGELYPYASLVVGTAASRRVRRRRAQRLMEWAEPSGRPCGRVTRFHFRPRTWDMITLHVVRAALRMDAERRRDAVAALLDDLAAMGRPTAAVVADVSPGGFGRAAADPVARTRPIRVRVRRPATPDRVVTPRACPVTVREIG